MISRVVRSQACAMVEVLTFGSFRDHYDSEAYYLGSDSVSHRRDEIGELVNLTLGEVRRLVDGES
jgi:hypothetical protein